MSAPPSGRDLAALVVPRIGSVVATDDPLEPYRLADADGGPVVPVASFLRELLAASRVPLTLRSYAMDLLRWWRFLAAVDVRWEQATPAEGRDFSLWIRQASKPGARTGSGAGGADRLRRRPQSRRQGMNGGVPGQLNPVTGKPSPGAGYAPRTVNHGETVLRTFYDFHREAGSGPMINPFPPGPGPARRAFACPPQPDGPVAAGETRTLPQHRGAGTAAGDPG